MSGRMIRKALGCYYCCCPNHLEKGVLLGVIDVVGMGH